MPTDPEVHESAPDAPADPEFEALPEPRRPGKRLTLVTLSVTAVVALLLAVALRGEAGYALRSGGPTDLGELGQLQPGADNANAWVRGAAELGTGGAIRYSRPLEKDSFRLAPVVGNPRLWVEIRVPDGLESPHYVPQNSFVGRLVPLASAGLRHGSLADEVVDVGSGELAADAWVLIDGEAPAETRWALGLVALFIGFAAFNVYGLFRLLRPVKS